MLIIQTKKIHVIAKTVITANTTQKKNAKKQKCALKAVALVALNNITAQIRKFSLPLQGYQLMMLLHKEQQSSCYLCL